MNEYMVYTNDGNSYKVTAENESQAREKIADLAAQSGTSISAVFEI